MEGLADLTKPPKSSAPGQYLGYALQPVRLCFHLLRVPDGHSVSLEVLEDVAVHAPGRLLLEQSKSALKSNPVIDKSVELWKAFANWSILCLENDVDPDTTDFKLFVTPCHSGPLVTAMDAAKTVETAQSILDGLKKWIKPSNADAGCHPHLAKFLAAGDAICLAIILNFRLECEADPLEPIKQSLRATLSEPSINDFCAAAIGLAKETADALIRDGKPAVIDAAAFRRTWHAFVRKHNLAGLLNPTTDLPPETDVKGMIDSAPLFVRQLDIVKMTPELVVSAVSDYLRTTADKINWASEGIIVEGSFDEFDQGLEKHFLLVKDEVEDLHGAQHEEVRGRDIYRRCVKLQLPLEGRTLPSHFVCGAFNILANSLRVGWHPKFNDLLGEH